MARGDRFFFYPTDTVYDRPEEQGLGYESVAFDSRDGTGLHGWFFPAYGGAACSGGGASAVRVALGTIVHCHGNAGNITGHYRFVAWLPRRGFNVLCFDYRGFGRSAGRPSRGGVVHDVHAAIEYVKTRPEVDAGKIVLFGQSLGGSAAIAAAAERDDLAGLAVEGAFASYQQEAHYVCRRSWWLWAMAGVVSRCVVAAGCDAIDHVERVGSIPKLFICGTADRIVDYRQTVALYESAVEPRELWVLEGGGHTEALIDDQPDAQDPATTRRERFRMFLEQAANGCSR